MHLFKKVNYYGRLLVFERHGLEEVANTDGEANFVAVSEGCIVDRSISNILISEAVVGTGNNGELNVAVIANVTSDASPEEGI